MFKALGEDFYLDTNSGRSLKLDRDTATKLRNNGQLLPDEGSGLRGGPMSIDPSQGPNMSMQPQEDLQILGVPSSPSPARGNMGQTVALQGIPREYGGAPPPPRVPVRGAPMPPPTGVQEGDVIIERTAPTRGGMRKVQESTAGIAPEQQANLVNLAAEAAALELEGRKAEAGAKYAQNSALTELFEKKAREEAEKRNEIETRMSARDEWTKNQIDTLNQVIETAAVEKPKDVGMFGAGDAKGIMGGLIGALSIAMGEYKSGMVGGENTAARLVNAAIDARLQNQRDQIKRRLDTAMASRSEVQRAQLIGNDMDNRLLSAVVEREFANELQAIQANPELSPIHEVAKIGYAAVIDRLQKNLMPAYQSVQTEAVNRYQAGSPGGVRVRVNPVLEATGEAAKIRQQIAEANNSAPRGKAAVYGGSGAPVGYLPEATAEKLNTDAINATSMVQLLDKVEELQRKGKALSPNDRAELERLNVIGTLKLAQSLSFRVGTEQDFERASAAVGSGDFDYLLNSNAFKASQMKKDLVQGIETAYGHYGMDSSALIEQMTNRNRLGK